MFHWSTIVVAVPINLHTFNRFIQSLAQYIYLSNNANAKIFYCYRKHVLIEGECHQRDLQGQSVKYSYVESINCIVGSRCES